ncbi:hypothetical protein GGR51DRAFT_87603 [Nemania sp. FL0031]|nr:hypothetical protein GGR51DRAFT_87603 [Nemania sp. FL0031]
MEPRSPRHERMGVLAMLPHFGASAHERVLHRLGRWAGGTLLHPACSSGDPISTKTPLECGADADIDALQDRRETPIIAAITALSYDRATGIEFKILTDILLAHSGRNSFLRLSTRAEIREVDAGHEYSRVEEEDDDDGWLLD